MVWQSTIIMATLKAILSKAVDAWNIDPILWCQSQTTRGLPQKKNETLSLFYFFCETRETRCHLHHSLTPPATKTHKALLPFLQCLVSISWHQLHCRQYIVLYSHCPVKSTPFFPLVVFGVIDQKIGTLETSGVIFSLKNRFPPLSPLCTL